MSEIFTIFLFLVKKWKEQLNLAYTNLDKMEQEGSLFHLSRHHPPSFITLPRVFRSS